MLALAAWWILASARVVVMHPVIGPAVDAVYATGTVEATDMMPVAPRMGARLVALNVDEGMRVRRGQVLAQLEDEDMANQIRQLQAQEEFARSDYRRDSMLLNGGAIARATYDRALSDWKAAHAATEQAKATAGFMKLVAPADGQVISRDGEIGQLAIVAILRGEKIHSEDLRMRQVGVGLSERDGEFARGVDITEENIGQRFGAADARVPNLDCTLHLSDPGHGSRTASLEHDNRARVGSSNGAHQLVLFAGQV